MPEAVLVLVAALLVVAVVIVAAEDASLRRRKADRVYAEVRRLGEPARYRPRD